MFGGGSAAPPGYRMRLTPLGRHGIRNMLVSEGHAARVCGELAAADAAALLDGLASYDDPAAFDAELTGWLAGRDEASAVNVLEAIRADADDLWRSGHPAAAGTMEATAAALRDSDKTLAKRLRRCAHKARNR